MCKVLDVAVIPDSPGTCVSVTETFHDVASYHMLHAEKESTGEFVLAANAVHQRHIPVEADYSAARVLLQEYFTGRELVEAAFSKLPKKSAGTLIDVGLLGGELRGVVIIQEQSSFREE